MNKNDKLESAYKFFTDKQINSLSFKLRRIINGIECKFILIKVKLLRK